MTEHKHAEVLRAIADGKEVEFRRSDTWYNIGKSLGYTNPMTHPDLEWRIKPEPKPPIVVERWVYSDGSSHTCSKPNIRFTFDPDTKLPIKVELI